MLIDTHAHIHHSGLLEQAADVVTRARDEGVTQLITVGVTNNDSVLAVKTAEQLDGVWAAIGIHPESSETEDVGKLDALVTNPKVVAIGECGLDYSRPGRTREAQELVFRSQIDLAIKHKLPMIWHVRDAFSDFFEITADYPKLPGVVHCFTSNVDDMRQAVERGYFIALNGIMTFSKLDWQLDVAKKVPLSQLVLETDCPFLAPVPKRGSTNEPAYLTHTAKFLANLRGESFEELSEVTTQNAMRLFNLEKV